MTAQPNPATVRARIEASRATLLDAIGRLTEQDFASNLGDGESVATLSPSPRLEAKSCSVSRPIASRSVAREASIRARTVAGFGCAVIAGTCCSRCRRH